MTSVPRPHPDLEALLVHDAFVRRLAHGLAHPDAAADLTQDVWVAALEAHATRRGSPTAWLAGITRRLARHRHRSEIRRARRERAAARPESTPSVADIAAREAVRRRVVDAVLALDEPYRTAVLLRYFEDLPPRRIARRLGVPTPTVHTRLKRALAKLRAHLDREHRHDRRAWSAPLLALARPRATPLLAAAAAAAVPGVLLMSTKLKLGAVAVAVAGLSLVVLAWPRGDTPGLPAPATPADPPGTTMAASAPAAPEAAGSGPGRVAVTPGTEADVPSEAATTGSLRVTVTWADGTPAARVLVRAEASAVSPSRRSPYDLAGRTDGAGEVRFGDVTPRPFLVVSPGRDNIAEAGHRVPVWATVVAGEEERVTLRLAPGTDVHGTVVDAGGGPVGGATVVLATWASPDADPIATTNADGTFRARSVPPNGSVGAIADGYAPSVLERISGSEGGEREVEIMLPGPGAALQVRVTGPDAEAVRGASVPVRIPGNTGMRPVRRPDGTYVTPPLRRWASTDEHGIARLAGLRPGPLEVAVFAPGLSPWVETIEARAQAVESVHARLVPGVTVTGTVTHADGTPAHRVAVVFGDHGDALHRRVECDPEGRYRVEDLPAGDLALRVSSHEHGEASTTLHAVPGQHLQWSPTLDAGLVLSGRVVAADGSPVGSASVEARHDPVARPRSPWFRFASCDADGRFTLTGCEPDVPVLLSVRPGGGFAVDKGVFHPSEAPFVLRITHADRPTCHVVGRVLDPAGEPAENVTVSLHRDANSTPRVLEKGDGRFRFGPLPPRRYGVSVESPEYGVLSVPRRTLAPGETWDVGDLRFERPGFVVISARDAAGAPVTGTPFRLRSDHGGWAEVRVDEGLGRSRPLAPGPWRLQVRGDGIASRIVPCDVRSGSEHRADVVLRPGTPVTLRLRLPVPQRRPLFQISIDTADGAPILETGAWARQGTDDLQTCLAPGSYRLTARDDDGSWTATASFAIPRDATADRAVELDLR